MLVCIFEIRKFIKYKCGLEGGKPCMEIGALEETQCFVVGNFFPFKAIRTLKWPSKVFGVKEKKSQIGDTLR